jgi:pilus assembly protein CpaB
MARRIALLVAAALVAALGAGLVFMYVTSNQNAVASESTTVYKATADIPAGTPGATVSTSVAQVSVPIDTVPADAVTDLNQINGLRAVTTVFSGQMLISAQFGENNVTGGLSIPIGHYAMAIQIGDPARVAGYVQPGSHVAVYSIGTGNLVLDDVVVLAIGPSTMTTRTTGTSTTEQISTAPIVLSVTPTEGAKLAKSPESSYLGLHGKS